MKLRSGLEWGQPESLETERVTDGAVLSIGILRLPAVFVTLAKELSITAHYKHLA